MSDKLKSRKLWAFIATFVVALANFVFSLGMPAQDVLYLVGLTASYILGQGYVDAKQQKVDALPSADLTNSIISIIQSEISKTGFGKNLPMEQILAMFKTILGEELPKINTTQPLSIDELISTFKTMLATEMSKINAFTVSPVMPIAPPVTDPVPPTGTPDIVAPAV